MLLVPDEIMSGPVRFEVDGRCAVITIDRPEVRNAIDPQTSRAVAECVQAVEDDAEIRVAILTGAPPIFSAGADLRAIAAGEGDALVAPPGGFAGITHRRRTKPLIAAVEGAALAGAFEIILACDLVVAADDAVFGLTEVKRGLVAAGGGIFRLGRTVPLKIALEMAMTGDPIDAREAQRHGLVNALAPPGDTLPKARELAERIAVNAPLAVKASRDLVLDCTFAPDADAWRRTEAAAKQAMTSAEVREGVSAFLEKRPANWSGS